MKTKKTKIDKPKIVESRTLFYPLSDKDELVLEELMLEDNEDFQVRYDGYNDLQGNFIDTPHGICQIYFEKSNSDIFTYDSDESGW